MAFPRVTEDGQARVTEAGVLRIEDGAGAPAEPAILMEDGTSYILLEDGSRILIE